MKTPLLPLTVFCLTSAVRAATSVLPVELPAPRPVAVSPAGSDASVPAGIRAVVTAVSTLRSSLNRGDAGTTLQLSFAGPGLLAGSLVTAVRFVRGEDDQGAKLTKAPDFVATPRFLSMGAPAASPRAGNLIVRGVSRPAEEIRFLEGEVDVAPLDSKGAVILVPDFPSLAGQTLDQPGLLEHSVEIIPLTAATVAAHASEYSGPPLVDCNCQAVFLVRDPDDVLASLTIEDANGRTVSMLPRARGGNPKGAMWVSYTFPNGLPERPSLRIGLAATESVRTYPFRLEGISLP